MYRHGWFQVAFARDLQEGLTPLSCADRRLMAVKRHDTVRLFDANCPHRGAHLAYGGTLEGAEVVCPFHGLRIHLGTPAACDALSVREYPCLLQGGMVFVRLSDRQDPDLPQALATLQDWAFISGFAMEARVSSEIAAENALDNLHFKSVHGLLSEPVFTVSTGTCGELQADGMFDIPAPPGQSAPPAQARYHVGAFSPGVVIAELRGTPPYNYIIISTATPGAEPHTCTIRVTLAFQRPFDDHFAKVLLEASRQGLEKDRAIWERLSTSHTPQWTPRDASPLAFTQFCRTFRD